MVSQFVSPHTVRLLGDLNYSFPEGIHAIGRLDNHSEGLLLLTTNPRITKLLFEGTKPHARTYLVQVKNCVTDETIQKLSAGIEIKIKTGAIYRTTACKVSLVKRPTHLDTPAHEIPAHLPNSWLTIELTEGKYHQVRKMVAAVGHKCRRLIRISIEDLHLNHMQPGEVMEINEKDFFEKLHL